jgi:hypothetical protein
VVKKSKRVLVILKSELGAVFFSISSAQQRYSRSRAVSDSTCEESLLRKSKQLPNHSRTQKSENDATFELCTSTHGDIHDDTTLQTFTGCLISRNSFQLRLTSISLAVVPPRKSDEDISPSRPSLYLQSESRRRPTQDYSTACPT